MRPASDIIKKLGGVTAVSKIVGVHRTNVHKWMRPVEKGGRGGMIPHRHIEKLIEFGQSTGIDIKPEDFTYVPNQE